jgi:hypothetical protein
VRDLSPNEQGGKVAHKHHASHRTPADVLDQAVVGDGLRRDHHLAAGKFTIIEAEKQAAAAIHFGIVIGAQGKCAATQSRQAHQHAKDIAEFA